MSSTHPMGGAALLQCAPDLELRLVSGTDVRVTSRGVSTPVSHLALRVLDAFRHPSSVNDAVARLRGDGAQAEAWVELTGCVLALRAAGALVDAATSRPVVRSHHGRFDSYPVHIRLLNDEVRTSRYQQAIRAVVRPGDVVVDIGTGSGVMAATAALAGASRVYAIERTEMARLARRVFEANGLADRITVIEALSNDVELPEQADVLVSEIIGNDPLAEGLLPVTADAIRRFLKPGARQIPSGIELWVRPYEASPDFTRLTLVEPSLVRDWHERYGIDFTPLLDAAAGRDHDTTIRARRARDWPPLGPAVRLADIDLTRPHPGTIRTATSLPIDRDGRLSALVLSFVAHLAPGIELSTLPEDVSATNSWTSLAWLPGTPPAAAAGARIGVDYSFTPRGSAFTLQSAVTA